MRDNDPLPDADTTLEADDATFDERELAGEIDILDNAMDAGLQTPGAAREAFKASEEDERT